jgi:cytochrome c-type biogenesis protein CcsB
MNFLKVLVPVIYGVSFIGFIFYLKTLEKTAYRLALGTAVVGFIIHTLYVGALSLDLWQGTPLTFNHTLIFFAWTLVLAYLSIVFGKIKAYSLGAFFLPLPITFFLLGIFLEPRESPFIPLLRSLWFPVHAISSLLSHAFLLLGFVSSLMYILQDRALKRKSFGFLFKRLPPLDSLERISERCLYQGFFFLSLGIISGAIWSELSLGDYWRWSAKEVLSLVLWLIYSAMIHQRVLIGWRGRKLAYMFAICSCIFILSFLVINLYEEGFHTYAR